MADGAPPAHVTPRNLRAPWRKAGVWVVVFVSGRKLDGVTVPLRGGNPSGRWGIPSVSFLTAGGRIDADFSIIERACRLKAPCVVLDLRREWRRIVEARRGLRVGDTGSSSELVVDQALWEHEFAIMVDFTNGLHIQPTSVDSAFNLFHRSNEVFITPFASTQNLPS